jgi:hypothetical protein
MLVSYCEIPTYWYREYKPETEHVITFFIGKVYSYKYIVWLEVLYR